MKWLLGYLAIGLYLTFAWNTQVQSVCGKPLGFAGMVLAPVVLPLLTPFIVWQEIPKCERMSLAPSSTPRGDAT